MRLTITPTSHRAKRFTNCIALCRAIRNRSAQGLSEVAREELRAFTTLNGYKRSELRK